MRILILLASLYFSIGLSQAEALAPGAAGQHPAPEKMATLIIGRDPKVPNTCAVELLVENKPVAQLPTGKSVSLDVPAGTLYLRARLQSADHCDAAGLASGQSVLLEPGETRQYLVMLDNNALFLAPHLH
ncbi:hypothetical protein PH586_18475 [Pseudomonas sp. SA3-5]|uniref:Uncharacterized protein n=1 Tax=Pseudomonas aestuarii TaxID=3018340 RepID=A0ABT4XJH4_9PSED|nr:hypothetical protein [Pseudomonas aestuarii]MDA7088375.1 hypothetical protein [Pseudomonas aestuarii]